MQAAKKLVLVDEFDREYKRLRRPVEAVAKTEQSLKLSDTLRNPSVADDRKVREYVAALHRYLNVRKEVPTEPEIRPNFTEPPPPPPTPPLRALSKRRTRRQRARQLKAWSAY